MTPFVLVDCEQRSPEWRQARLGRLTGSSAAEMLSSTKSGGEAAARRNLRVQLVLERITGRSLESGFESAAMIQGREREADAVGAYEAFTGDILQRSGFLAHPELMAGVSLDGHLGNFDRVVEIKSPTPAIHLEYLRSGKVPGDYAKQVLHALWITGARWCDWFSFNPDFPESLRLKLVRVNRDEAAIADYEQKARAFLAEVDREQAELIAMARDAA